MAMIDHSNCAKESICKDILNFIEENEVLAEAGFARI